MMRRTIVLLTISLLLAAPGAAQVLASTPTTVSAGETFTATVEAAPNASYDLDVDITGPQDATRSFDSITGAKTFSLALSTPGTYLFNGTVTYSNGTTITKSSSTTVTEYTDLDVVQLAPDPPASCPFTDLYGECRTAGIDLSDSSPSPLSGVSSETVMGGTFDLDGTTYHLRAVADGATYDTLYIDDDSTFEEATETGEPQRSVTEGATAFVHGDHTLRVLAVGSDHVVFVVPPRPGTRPYRAGDDLVVTAHAANASGAVAGLELSFAAGRLGADTSTFDVDGSTGDYGFLQPQTVSGLSTGQYAITAGEAARSIVEVREFDIGYSITDATGSPTRTVEPGTTLSVEAYPLVDGERVSADASSISLVLPDGRTLTPSNGSVTIPADASAGSATVSMSVTRSGTTQTLSTDLAIRTFKVMTVPLKETEYGLQRTEGFAPGSTGYLFVGAVKLGTAGTISELQQATFFQLENASTASTVECEDNVGPITGRIGGSRVTLNTSVTSVADSRLIQAPDQLPDGFSNQCIASFTVPDRTGRFVGSIAATRERTGAVERGSFVFSSRRYEARGEAVDPASGNRVWQRGTDQQVGISPTVFSLDTQDEVPAANVTDMELVELRGPTSNVSATFRNASMPNGPMLVLGPVGRTGSYRAVFRATINVTENGTYTTGTATGRAYFQARAFDIDVSRAGGFGPVGPNGTVTLDIDVTEPGGSSGVAGVLVNVTTLYNERTESSALARVATTSYNHTNATGDATLTLDPSSSWRTGDHRIRLTAAKDGDTATGYSFFRAERYRTSVRMNNGSYGAGVIGDVQNFSVGVRDTTTLSPVSASIDLTDSTLTYRGRSSSISQEEVPLDPNATVSGGRLSLRTAGMRPGRYELRVALDVGQHRAYAERSFRLRAFDMSVARLGERFRPVAPGGTVRYNVSFAGPTTFTTTVESVRNFGADRRYNVSALSSPERATFSGRRWAVFNVTLPGSAANGFHSIELGVNTSEGETSDRQYVEVRQYTAGAPVSAEYYYGTTAFTNETSEQFDYYQGYNASCTNVTATNGLTVDGGSLSAGHDCYVRMNDTLVSASEYERYNMLYNNDTDRFWVSADTVLNESTDLASNSTAGTFTAAGHNGVQYALERSPPSAGAPIPDVNITVDGAFTNGVVADTTATVGGGYTGFSGYTGSPATVRESRMRADLNGDGDTNDSVYAVSELSAGSVAEVWVSADLNFTAGSRADLAGVGTGGSVAGFTVYRGQQRQDRLGNKTMLYAPVSGYYPFEPTFRPRQNATVPVLVTYPNGTAFSGANVSVAELVRSSSGDTVRYEPDIRTASDSNGMAFLEVNLTVEPEDATAPDTGAYTIVPGIETARMSSPEPLDRWEAPRVRAELYSVDMSEFQSATVNLASSGSMNSTELEAATGLTGVPASVNDVYRYAVNVSEAGLGQGCFDLDDNGACDTASVLLYNASDTDGDPYGMEPGMDPSKGLVTDGVDMGYVAEEFRRHILGGGGVRDMLFNNTATVGYEDRYSGNVIPYDFMVFNESQDNATVFRERWEPAAERSLTLGVTVTDLYDSSAGKQVNVTVLDEDGGVAATANTSARFGTALVELEPWELGVAPAVQVATDENATTVTWDGSTIDIAVTNVTASMEAVFEVSGDVTATTEPLPEGTTFSFEGVTFHVTEVISTGGGSGSATVAVKEWPTDEYIEIRGHVSSGTSEQPFSTYVGFE